MPKRARTPPPSDDEPRYLSVVYPYPLHANMELPVDRAECARWLASCIGKDPLLALYHKPSAPNMIIIEVQRDFSPWEKLLGEHRWKEVFKNPDPAYKHCVSQIFWCMFATGRTVQKHGWKRVDVQERWFHGWAIPNKNVFYPYPATHWCEVPPEDKTNAPLCRPLPVRSFPPPNPATRPPPVGSPAWLESKQAPAPAPAKSVWSKGPPPALKVQAPVARPASKYTPVTPKSGIPIQNGGKTDVPWGPGWDSPSTSSKSPDSATSPPGLTRFGTPNSASSGSSSYGTAPPAISRGNSTASGVESSEGAAGVGLPVDIEPGPSLAGGDFITRMAALDFDEAEYDDEFGMPAAAVVVEEIPTDTLDGGENLWADYEEKEVVKKIDGDIICPVHGVLCSKGICTEYKRLARERDHAAQAAARAEAFETKKKQKNKNKRDQKRGLHIDAPGGAKLGWSVPRARPAHLEAAASPPPVEPIKEQAEPEPTDVPTPPTKVAEPTVRSRPAHLANAATAPTSTTALQGGRPARGRRLNSAAPATATHTVPITKAPSVPKTADAKSVASSASGWGNVSRGPWGSVKAPSVREADDDASTVNGDANGKSWADQMDDEDGKSVAASSTSGWGNVSNGPW